jgi:hypothetical protein
MKKCISSFIGSLGIAAIVIFCTTLHSEKSSASPLLNANTSALNRYQLIVVPDPRANGK